MAKLDDVSWHLGGGEFPQGLPEESAATHIGCFVAWAIDRGLWGQPSTAAERSAIDDVASGRMSARGFVLQECDGKLFTAMLIEECAAFADKCYEAYVEDYLQTLTRGLGSDYLVSENAANQKTMAAILDRRFEDWKRRPWWKFW